MTRVGHQHESHSSANVIGPRDGHRRVDRAIRDALGILEMCESMTSRLPNQTIIAQLKLSSRRRKVSGKQFIQRLTEGSKNALLNRPAPRFLGRREIILLHTGASMSVCIGQQEMIITQAADLLVQPWRVEDTQITNRHSNRLLVNF